MPFRRALLAVLLLSSVSAFAATQGGEIPLPLPLFPQNNWWNLDISNAPVDASSANFINFINTDNPSCRDEDDNVIPCRMHPDFGGDAGDGYVYGFPFTIVEGTQPKLTVEFTDFGDESDGWDPETEESFPFYPVPSECINQNGWIEGGQPGTVDERGDSDRHILIVDKDNNHLYELYNVWYNGTNWEAASGAFFDMNTNDRRPEGWTSADAAGLAILPGLVRYDEVFGPDEIRHAFRVTVRRTNGHIWPASHTAGGTAGALPMGARLRLKASKNISGYAPEIQKILRAMKKYGLIVADNGSDMYVSGVYDTRWDNDILNPAFHGLNTSDFEVVQRGWKPPTFVLTLPATVPAGDAVTGTLTAYDANYNVATGYTGTVQFTSTDGAATLPLNYTFTAGDNGVHTFTNGFTLRTPGSRIVTVTDVATATLTTSAGVTVETAALAAPTGLTATATSPTQVNLAWAASAGATQYDVVRTCTTAAFAPLTTTAATSYPDTPAPSGATCVYKVRASDGAGGFSPFSAPDAATTILFTDDPLTVQVTKVKAVHLTQLRQAVNAMRATAGLGAFSFTDPALSSSIRVKAVHVTELRTALNPARAALGLSALTYTDPTVTAGTTRVKAAHVQELRAGVK
ncbi:MAG TPA: hypothetical protein VEK57_23955 [Thermoanaerobaculia bacterium]|nr:hypothetical protein [Thermoanaerobaculia bacterium]